MIYNTTTIKIKKFFLLTRKKKRIFAGCKLDNQTVSL